MAIENELNYLFQPSTDVPVSSVGTLMPQAATSGASGALSALGPVGAIYSVLSLLKSFNDKGREEKMNEGRQRDAALEAEANRMAPLENLRTSAQSKLQEFYDKASQVGVPIPPEFEYIKDALKEENLTQLRTGAYSANITQQDLEKLNNFDIDSYIVQNMRDSELAAYAADDFMKYESKPGSRGYLSPELLQRIHNRAIGQPDLTSMNQQQIQSIAQPATTGAASPSLYGANPPAGAVAGANTTTQPLQGSFQGGQAQAAPQQNFLQRLMAAFQGPGNNNMLAQVGQGAGIGAGNSMGLNPALGATVGAGLGQIGSAFGNLFGGSQTGTQTGQQSGQQQPGQPPQQPGGFSNQNYFNGMPSGVNTGDAQQSNPLNDLFAAFGIQNPAQAGLGAGILGLGSALEKDVTLPDFWSDRGVQDLANWGNTADHPMDANVEAAIQRSMDIQNEQQLRNLRDVYKNARPGGDYLNDSAYQRDLANLQRSMALNTADAKAGSQLQSNAQQIGVKTDLAAGSVGQGRAQALLDTQKQTNQNKLFGDLGSAFIQGSLQKPATTNVQTNF